MRAVAAVLIGLALSSCRKPETDTRKEPAVSTAHTDVADLVAGIKPAVVNITSLTTIQIPDDDDFQFPFDTPSQKKKGDRVLRRKALGSGFILDKEGHVVTNAHVIQGADVVKVRLSDERELEAKVRGRDERLDVAILQIEDGHDIPHVKLGSSDALRVGETVIAVGNPFGLSQTVTMGIVSAKDRAIGAGPYDEFIQTDASINPGNSGGPLFDMSGNVVGIATAINPNGQGIGFATPIDAVKSVLPQLLETGRVSRGRLGVMIAPIDSSSARALDLKQPRGALVSKIEPGGPAAKAGVKVGDVIVGVDGQPVVHSTDLPRLVARHPPGTKIKVTVLRDRKGEREISVTLEKLQEE